MSEEIAAAEKSSRYPAYLHWCPNAVETDPLTSCGLNIDYPKALAWTRSTDLEQYRHQPYEKWPPPCPICEQAAAERAAITARNQQ